MEYSPSIDKYRDLRQFCTFANDGSMHVLDVLTSEPLQPNKIPPSVERDELCAQGFETLKQLGRDGLQVPLVMGYHRNAADFMHQFNLYGDILLQSPIVGIEADWEVRAGRPERITDFTPTITKNPGRREFTTRQLTWLEEQGIWAVPCDLDGPDDLLRQRLRTLWELDVSWLPEAEARQVQATAVAAYNCTRQWVMMGHFGYWLSQLEARNIALNKPMAPLMLGSAHQSIAEKFATLGVNASLHIARPDEENEASKDFIQLFIDVTRNCRASPAQLAVPLPG